VADALGKFVCDQFERAIGDKVTARTKALLAPCFEQLEDAVGALCPAAVTTGPQGVAAAYGPMVGDSKRIVVFATPKSYLIVGVTDWPSEITPLPKDIKHAELWAAVADAVDAQDMDMAMTAFLFRIGLDHTKIFDAELQRASQSKLTPIIVVLAAKNEQDTVAAGGSQVCVLPPSLEAQIAKIEGTAQ
jgi:hypothetical protein